MKKTKKLIALFLCAVVLITSANIDAYAATVTPYSGIEYKYSKTVSRGTLRYISQCSSSSNYHSEYWGKYSALHECGTSSMSMALSYVGVNVTPGEILEKYNGSTVFASNWGGINASKDYTRSLSLDAFETAWDKYVSGEGQYSPPIIHINGNSSNIYYKNGHFMLVIGKNSDGTYKILDPYDEQYGTTWNATISNGKIIIKLGSKSTETRALADVRQYHNSLTAEELGSSTDVATPPTISGEQYPETLVVGKSFTIKGDIKSESALTSVIVSVQDYSGKNYIVNKSTPNTKTFSIEKFVDKYVKFGSLPVGHYKYIVEATNAAGTTTLLSKAFVVTSSNGEVPPLPGSETTIPETTTPESTSPESTVPETTEPGTETTTPEVTEPGTETPAPEVTEPSSETAPAVEAPEKPVISSISNASKGMTVKWGKVKNASGYYIYRKNSDGKYKKVGTVTSGSTVSYNDKDANTSGTSYSYKVYAYRTENGTTAKSSASSVKTYIRVGTVSGLSLSSPSKKKIKVAYSGVSKSTGYQIQYSRYSDYKDSLKVTTTAKSKTLTTSKSKAKYYVRVRAKIVKGSTTYYGAWTSKTITVK